MSDNKNNFYLKINLYIIRAIYKKLGKKLCSDFLGKKINKKVTYTRFHEIIGVDKQRLDRIISIFLCRKRFDYDMIEVYFEGDI